MTSRQLRKSPGQGVGHYPDSVYHLHVADEDQLHPQIIKQARSCGQLNLSNRGLISVPSKVWSIGELSKEEAEAVAKGVSLDTEATEGRWWEQVDLDKLILACNKISTISADIAKLTSLSVLDLHDNQLARMPGELGLLTNLKKLNLSHNRLEEFPEGIYSLRELRTLQLNNNNIPGVAEQISELDMLTLLDLAENRLSQLPANIGYLVSLQTLNLSKNKLESLPEEVSFMRGLKSLDLTNNKLKELPEAMKDLSHLELLYLRHNQLNRLPCLRHCTSLKELYLGSNKINVVQSDDINNIINVRTLDLSYNKIGSLPDEMVQLQLLERLDLTNNDLAILPFTLGVLPHLKTIQVEGNPMKTIRRDILARGTTGLLKYLRSRLEADQLAALAESGSGKVSPVLLSGSPPVPDKFTMRSSQTLNLAKKGLNEVPLEAVANAVEARVQAVDLSKNSFATFPQSLEELMSQLYELNLSSNKIPSIPSWIATATHLQFLELSNNRLTDLPAEVGQLSQLREICLSLNQLTSIPACLTTCQKLETILIANNKVSDLDVGLLSQLTRLAVLDLQNNAIQTVPPELGNLTQIRSLQLEGNLFRMPRPAILVQGTAAVLAYLRDRIPK